MTKNAPAAPLTSPRAPPLVLASGSRFRRQMLENAGLAFTVEVADVDEPAERDQLAREQPSATPGDVALHLATLKACAVSRRHPQVLVIGADQVLELDGRIFGKPVDQLAARRQLKTLRAQTHTLPTAVVLAQNGQIVWHHVATATLTMRSFSDTFLDTYLKVAGSDVTETVGGYALEGLGVQLFERVDGDYFTIIGLPVMPLLAALRRHGVVMV